MKGLTFKVVLFSGYTLSPAMLPLLEMSVEILCPNTFMPYHHILLNVYDIPKTLSLQNGF